MSIAMAAVWITFICCVTAVLMFWIDARSGVKAKQPQLADPEQVLAERFAQGELTEAEYAQRLSVLRMGPPLEVYFDR